MEWGFFSYLAELLAAGGFTVVRFNFTGSGMRPGDELVTDRESFRTATFSRDLEELLALLEALAAVVAPERVDPRRIGLFGHSRGGGTALLAAAHAEWRGRLAALVTWAAVSTFDRLNEDDKRLWRRQGWIPVVNARTGQELQLHHVVLDDLESHSDELDLLTAASRRRAPWLIVHGLQDESVPAREADDLWQRARSPARRLLIQGASHTFGARHPFAGPTPELMGAVNATQAWFLRRME